MGGLGFCGIRGRNRELAEIGDFLTHRVRLGAHVEALRRFVTPSSIVLDVGAGLGLISLLACRLGAKRVYAVEPTEDIQFLEDVARDNGLSDRIVVLRKRPTEVSLPEPADLIVSDVLEILPHHRRRLADLADARQRLLAPGGRVVPETDTLWLAVASASEAFERTHRAWQSNPYGLNLSSALRSVDNTAQEHRALKDDLLCEPTQWARIHYPSLREFALRGRGTFTVTRPGTAHGLVVWFDTELAAGIGYSNAPGSANAVNGQILFTWPEPVSLRVGDEVNYDLRADPVGSNVVWTWATEIYRASAPDGVLLRARQSTFGSAPISAEALHKRAGSFTPSLSFEGDLVLSTLEGMRSGKTIRDLAGDVLATNPEYFRTLDDAHGFVGELSARYSK